MWQKNKKRGAGQGAPKDRGREGKDARSFINNHPATQGALPRAADRSFAETTQGEQDANEESAALSQQILVYHESQPADTGNDWMYKLKEDSMQYLAEKKGVQLEQIYRETVYKKGVETLIDKTYGLLQRYAFEFNQVAGGTELHVSGTISGDVTEVTRYNKLREVEETQTYFRARLSTRSFSLVLRGRDDSVEFYLIPATRVMALSKSENEYKPLARIQVKISELGMMWRMQDANPPVDSLDELSMWLFTKLITATKDAAREDSQATGT